MNLAQKRNSLGYEGTVVLRLETNNHRIVPLHYPIHFAVNYEDSVSPHRHHSETISDWNTPLKIVVNWTGKSTMHPVNAKLSIKRCPTW